MAQEDDLRALGKIMDFLRAVSIILAIMNVYWYCYEAMHIWGVTIGVVDRILINFNRICHLVIVELRQDKLGQDRFDILVGMREFLNDF